jgi:small subunit ribosomal protein S3
MGQKVNPIGLRIGIIREWDAKWYAPKQKVADTLLEDLKVRKYLVDFYKAAYVSRIEIKRTGKRVIVTIHAAKPGLVIGTQGSRKNEAVKALEKMTGKTVFIVVTEIKQSEADKDAVLVARRMAEDLENRVSFRRVQKMAIQRALKAGVKGIKTNVKGRLGGAEIARQEGYIEGSIPRQTLRANIDYALAEAHTTYGKLGVKVWINKGEVLPAKKSVVVESKQDKEAK